MKFASFATTIVLSFQGIQGFTVSNGVGSSRSLKMSSSAEKVSVETETSAGDYEISPEFGGAMKKVTGALAGVVGGTSLESPLKYFCNEYFTACDKANQDGADVSPTTASENMMNALQYGMKFGMEDKFTFGVTHKAMRGDAENEDGNTVDYYKFGCDFFKPAIDMKRSVLLGEDALQKASKQIEDGENVVFFANHQSEADPQVMSILMEDAGFNKEAADMVYVAGHKVTTDTLAIPFSMGRNLICIHSKKHINADPETKPYKSKQNLLAMNGMLRMKKKGGALIWVAPSGGRDRRDLETGEVPIAPFDQKTIDMFRLLGNKSKVPTHFYSVSMVSYDLCPPPDVIEAGTGEQRNVRYVPVGIKISDELDNVGGVESRHLFTDHAFDVCQEGYNELLVAIKKNEE